MPEEIRIPGGRRHSLLGGHRVARYIGSGLEGYLAGVVLKETNSSTYTWILSKR